MLLSIRGLLLRDDILNSLFLLLLGDSHFYLEQSPGSIIFPL